VNWAVDWAQSPGLTDYRAAETWMRARAEAVAAGLAGEYVWLLEHPPLYTAGLSAKSEDLLDARFPVHRVERGGQMTYHGPGQRVVYVMLDLAKRGKDLRAFVRNLERWLIAALAELGVASEVRDGRVGVWTVLPDGREAKIAAIGVRVRRWASYHGVALNVAPDLSHFGGIVPCGIRDHGVTSLKHLGMEAGMSSVDRALRRAFETVFESKTRPVDPPLPPASTGPDGAPADAAGDFFYDELMTAQPDAAAEYFRARLRDAVKID